MAVAQHRAPIVFAVSTRWATAVAIAAGAVFGFGVWAAVPGHRPFVTAIVFGLILAAPAAVAVVLARRTVAQGVARWVVGVAGLLALLVIAALLFALSQLDAGVAPIGATAGVATGVVSLVVGLSRWHSGEAERRPEWRPERERR